MRKPARPRKMAPQNLPVPEAGEGKRGVEGHFGYLLRQASAAQRARTDRALADLGVTTPQFAVLTMLNAYPGISNADTARLSMLTPQTVSVIVANLEKAGWIARRPHEVHGRIQHIDVTDSGRKVLAQCRSRVETVNRRMAAGLTAAEEKIVRRWLVELAKDEGV
jgi:DNA-binding MarR family transcriptional regulator